MSELFIPPDGAMQFELTVGPNAFPLEESIPVWVRQPIPLERIRSGCVCKTGWPVIEFCDPNHAMRPKSAVGQTLADIMVCNCIGKIIE